MEKAQDLSVSEYSLVESPDYLETVDENLSFTPTKKVYIRVRDLSIQSNLSATSNRLFQTCRKCFQKVDVESSESTKTLLYPMSFDVPPNSLTCIVGGSGSGKTTLLNALANRKFNVNTISQKGSILYNQDTDLKHYRHAYVIQQDILIPTLTCFETLMYSAELKLPKLTSWQQRRNLVHEILLILGLKECKDTLVGDNKNKGLSGGERRRLSVGLQLISNPSVLFLDEPTTGLDNYNAYLLCKSLHHLAKRLNKTIIMSIHQPRADIFKLFDVVLILSKGKLCYGDSFTNIEEHFESLGFPLPKVMVNPVDYYVDITSIDTRTRAQEIESMKRVDLITAEWEKIMTGIAKIKGKELRFSDDVTETEIFQQVGRAPFLREVNILIRRNLTLQRRDPFGWFSILFEALFLGLLCGWIFFKPDSSLTGVRTMEAALYSSSSLQCYLFMLYETYRLCQFDLKFFDRERMEDCVSVHGFLIARRISKFMTEDFWIPLLFSVTTYFMYGLRTDSAKYFFKYFAGILIFNLNTMSFATLAASISRDVPIATLVGNLNFTFQSMTNGMFVNATQMPVYVRWCKYVAYLWYSYGYLASNQFSDFISDCYKENKDNPNVQNLCYQYTGSYIMQNLGFWEHWNALPICVVLAFAIGYYLLAGIIFYVKPLDMAMGKEIKNSDTIDNSVDYDEKLNDITNGNTSTDYLDPQSNYICVSIRNVGLTVENRLKKSNKLILDNVNADFIPGELNAIMGPSGSGKTSLLNLLSGRLSSNYFTQYTSTGEIYLNSFRIRDCNIVKPVCSYVVQEDDHLLSGITVRETLRYAARLRLSRSNISVVQQNMIVDDIILKMGLRDCANTIVGNELLKGISGGEKRRLSIAIQLIASPKILFLDEPTSGLDSFTAASIIECLKKLTQHGTTIIMTIHQPRTLSYFASILLLAKGGKVAFNGPERDLIPHFSSLGYPIPIYTNLADFVIDLISYNTSNETIEIKTKARVRHILEAWNTREFSEVGEKAILLETEKDVEKSFKAIIKQRAGFFIGFSVITSRQWTGLVRDKNILVARSTQVLGMGIILMLFFSRLKHNTRSIQDRFGLIQQFTSLYFTGMLNNMSSYPQERDYFYIEYADDAVGSNSFFFSYLLIELPFEIIACLIFAIFVVFVIGLQIKAGIFFTIFYGTFMVVNAGESLGISFNTIIDHPGFAMNIISVFCSIGVCMSGLLSMNLDKFLKAINYVSPLHYCVMLVANEVFTDSLKLTCSKSEALPDGKCLFSTGADVLELYDLKVDKTLYFVLFSVIIVLQRFISWSLLKVRLTKLSIKSLARK